MCAEHNVSMVEPIMNEASRCQRCGHELLNDAVFCARCGEPLESNRRTPLTDISEEWEEASDRSRLVALLLCVLLGYLGVHRFYVGKIGTGILWLMTGGMFGVGYIVDAILIATGHFRDHKGLSLIFWDSDLPLFQDRGQIRS
jgi:ribosomal protein L37E